jgi:epoxyqueuosine reductase
LSDISGRGKPFDPAAIKAKARELGFDLCGIAPAEAFPELGFFREWIDRGYAGDMAWLPESAEQRADVRQLVAGARSVIATATLYNTDRPYSDTLGRDVARIARYAWGDDYHEVIKTRLKALRRWMEETSPQPFDSRVYVDTGPVQERVYAQYAGLGWVGKNTCLINPEIGSWLFLGVIITTLPLAADAEGLEQCGSCTRCLDACPTGALVDAGVLDATRCISYLTIEARGPLPVEHLEPIGTHIYGCDICQEVCPYNQPAPVSADPHWQPRAGLDLPALVDLAGRSDDELFALLRHSPMKRVSLELLRRNLVIALANTEGAAEAGAEAAEERISRRAAEKPRRAE